MNANKDPERSRKRNRPKQLQTYNILTHDTENTNGTNQGDLQLVNKPRIILRGIEGMPQVNQSNRNATIYLSKHLIRRAK